MTLVRFVKIQDSSCISGAANKTLTCVFHEVMRSLKVRNSFLYKRFNGAFNIACPTDCQKEKDQEFSDKRGTLNDEVRRLEVYQPG